MTNRNIAAWTPNEPNPPFVSINDLERGKIELHLRGRPADGEPYGAQASVVLTDAEAISIAKPLLQWLRGRDRHFADCAMFNEIWGVGPNGQCDCRR